MLLYGATMGLRATIDEINQICQGNTATAGEISQVCDGNSATAAEISQVCDGNTATAAELSQLHNQGLVAADFAKLLAIADSQAYTTLTPGGGLTGTNAIRIAKIGRIVTMTWSEMTHSLSTSAQSSAGVIPAAYRPIVQVDPVYNVAILQDGGGGIKRVRISTSGTLTFYYFNEDLTYKTDTVTAPGTVAWISAN
jgi:hypothetical protein